MLKRTVSLLCALVLLLTSFSGLTVFAAETDEVATVSAPATAAAEEPVLTIDGIELEEKTLFPERNTISTYNSTALESWLTDAFMEYLLLHYGNCEERFSIEQFKIPADYKTQLQEVIWYETPELFHAYSLGFGNNGTYLTTAVVSYVDYADTPAEYASCMNKIKANAEYLLRDVADSNLSDVEKALVLHDRLAVFTEYDLGNMNKVSAGHKIYNAFGVLGEGLGVCQGYAMSYMYLLEKVGIESDLCSSHNLNHAWNIVYINGVAYHTDVTWDDPTNSSYDTYYDDLGRVYHRNFLRSSNGIWETGHKAYDYITTPYDTRYDSGLWWQDSNTSIEWIGNALYYLDCNNGRINKVANNVISAFYDTGYRDGKLSGTGFTLLYSTQADVYRLNPETKRADLVFTCAGFVEGMKYEKGQIICQVDDDGSYRHEFEFEDAPPAKIVKQPANVTVLDGATAKTSVSATGDGLKYVWYYKNKGETKWSKSSITTNTYSTTMNATRAGRQVYCVVTDKYGNSVTSNVATLSMKTVAKITKQPTNAVAPNGKQVKTTITATGDGLKYEWYFKNKGATTWSKSSLTGNSYYVTAKSSTNGRQVYCKITDKYGNSVKSSTVTLYMGNAAKITKQPANAVAANGTQVKTTLTATGDGLKYEWYFKNKGATTWSKGSLTGNSYYVTAKSTTNGRQVYCKITDKYGTSVKSNVVTLYMGNVAKITKQPVNAYAANGAQVKTTLTATGDGLKYEWYFKNAGSSTWSKSSLTGNSYYVTMKSTTNNRQVYCVVTDKYGTSVKSNVVTLSLKTPLKITKQPTNAVAANGKQVKTTLTATGDGLKYEWYYKNKGATTWTKGSLTGNSYYVTAKSTTNGRQVYCKITDKYGTSVKSNVVTLYMGNAAKITKQPVNAVAANGAQVKTSLTATGDGLKYEWYFKNAGSSTWSKSSLTGNCYYVTMKSTTKNRQVYCVVTDKYGTSVKSNVVTLSLKTPLKITKQPTSVTVANGTTAKTSVTATGDGLKYEWYFKNKGASAYSKSSITTNTYTMTMDSTRNGRQVYCVVKDKYGNSVKSNVVTLSMQTISLNDVTGYWYSTEAYSEYYGSYDSSYTASSMYISSSGVASIYIGSNSFFTSGNFTYYLAYDYMHEGLAYFRVYTNTDEIAGVYDPVNEIFTLEMPNRGMILFER